jgi:hypothetical protein
MSDGLLPFWRYANMVASWSQDSRVFVVGLGELGYRWQLLLA